MEALSTKTLELGRMPAGESTGLHRLFYGNYSYYLERTRAESASVRSADSASLLNRPRSAQPPASANEKSAGEASPGGGNAERGNAVGGARKREQDKQKQALLRRLAREEEEILRALETLETEKAALEAELSRPEVYSSGEKAKAVEARLRAVLLAIEEKTMLWEAKAAELSSPR
jgi:ATP-binding cassette subfamily F protein 3